MGVAMVEAKACVQQKNGARVAEATTAQLNALEAKREAAIARQDPSSVQMYSDLLVVHRLAEGVVQGWLSQEDFQATREQVKSLSNERFSQPK